MGCLGAVAAQNVNLSGPSTAGERPSEELEAGSGERPSARRPQPDSRHAGDRDEPAEPHGRADPQTERGGGQGETAFTLSP